jgi:nitroreductase
MEVKSTGTTPCLQNSVSRRHGQTVDPTGYRGQVAEPSEIRAALAARSADPSAAVWRPVRFDPSSAGGRGELCELLASGAVRVVCDTIEDQLRELAGARDPKWPVDIRELTGGAPLEHYGIWVFYPWSARLVHVLPEAAFRELRADRNRHKITTAEQARLHAARIGIVGLSVGNMAALTCTLEGVGTRYRIADPDVLSLSNLNRLRASVADLGVDKTIIAARQMFEIDPFLDIERVPGGVTPEGIDAFLAGLDLLVEECDELAIKVLLRERARAHRIPVVMDTSDRGLLDVERFDLEPQRPVLHGLLGDTRAESLFGLATRDKAPYLLAILGEDRMSTRFAASLPDVKESLAGWPQLASSVALGGAVIADVARKILLGEPVSSGRYYVDLDAIVDESSVLLREPVTPARDEIAQEARAPRTLPALPAPGLSDDSVRWLVAVGTLAPSAHNAQPWRFTYRRSDATLACIHDPRHDMPMLDFEHGATWLAFGAFAESVAIAAPAVGIAASFALFPDMTRVCDISLAPGPVLVDPLLPMLAARATNRRLGVRSPLSADDERALIAAAAEHGAHLQLLTHDAALAEIGALIGAADRLTILDRAIHAETMAGLRWTRAEVEATRDGIDVATLELSPADRAGMRLLSRWRVAEAVAAFGGGRALEKPGHDAIAASSAVALLTVRGTQPGDYFTGGRAVQRMWLTATARGLAIQPMTSLPYLFARFERGGGAGLSEAQRTTLADLRVRYRVLFDVATERAEVLLVRIARADPPTARALRRNVDDVLGFA